MRLCWPGDEAAGPTWGAGRLSAPPPPDLTLGLIEGDNALALDALRATHAGAIALVYLDPPFFTGRVHEGVVRGGGGVAAFDDRWPDLGAYLGWMRDRLELARELLSPEGSLVVHVDPKTSHYVRVLGDMVFGPEAFASEIVWRYRRWPSKARNFQRVHDTLLRFVREPRGRPRFRQLFEPLAPSTQAVWRGRRQRALVDGEGRRTRSSMTDEPSPGTPLGDVWDIGIVAPSGRERTGYPTQKPEALLERLLLACSDPGDWVLDPTLGSGTTLAVAARLGRRALGVDESGAAIAVARARLGALGLCPWEARAARAGRRAAL
ncbi:MAG TPA: site-specific DNA-methyltransferase [Polyangiaceae bacterium]|nr:site-specific DNA-methyltransferase [Polyangiaceae bacterium]